MKIIKVSSYEGTSYSLVYTFAVGCITYPHYNSWQKNRERRTTDGKRQYQGSMMFMGAIQHNC